MATTLEIRKARRRKELELTKGEALAKYDERKAEIQKLLKQIAAGLEQHDKNASISGGHHWGHVGDLGHIVGVLAEVNARLPRK